MPGPWEKYQSAPSSGPWAKYAAAPDQLPTATVTPTPEEMDAAQPRSFGQDLLRAGIMTGRNVVHGALSLPAMLNDATLVPAINAVSKSIGSDYREAPSSQQLDAYMNTLGLPNPQPENGVERVVSGIDRGAGGLLSGVGIGGLLKASATPVAAITGAGAPPAYGVAGVGDALTSHLGAQTAATVAGAGASEVAREAGFGPVVQIALGLAGGGAPALYGAGRQALATGAGKLLSAPSPQAAELANQALDAGIPLKASQVSPSKVAKLVDSVSAQVPFSGAQPFQEVQQQAFNRAVGRTIGVDSPTVTADVFAGAKQRIGSEFERLTANNNLPLTPELVGKLRAVADEAASLYGADAQRPINTMIDRLLDQSQGGVVPGRAYQSIDSAIGKVIGSGGEKSVPLGDLRSVLRDAMDQSIRPEDQAAWTRARQQWRDLKTLEPLVAKDNIEGNISPGQLLGRVAANNSGKAAMASGRRGDLGNLANMGQRFLKQQIPDSGTAQRNFAGKALGSVGSLGSGLIAGGLLGPLGGLMTVGGTVGGARGVQSALQSEAMVNALLGRKPTADKLGQLMMMSADPAAQSLIQR